MRQVFALTWLLAEFALVVGIMAGATPANADGVDWVIATVMVALVAAMPATMIAALAAWVVLMLRFATQK